MSQPNGIREKWSEAFEPEIPSLMKGVEVKNRDGSYSCITCGIKKDCIADWFMSHFSTELTTLEEKIKETIGEEEKLEMDYGDHPKDQFKHGANHERWKNKRGVLSLLSDLKNKYK